MTTTSSYRHHLDVLEQRAAVALARAGRDHLVVAAGVEKFHFLDDRPYPFQVNPHFKHWVPLLAHPHSWVVVTPGARPRLICHVPEDFWHLPPAAPSGDWVRHWDVQLIGTPDEAKALLPPPARSAILGEVESALGEWVPDNPQAVLDHLHFHRGCKTPWEIERLRAASARAVRGHRAAVAAFRADASEHAIHLAYLEASAHSELDLPYGNIVALNRHAAVLHYQHQDRQAPSEHRSLLIDAGASCDGYAADITRTSGRGDADFQALVQAVDEVQRALVDQVRPGRDYAQLHLDCHLRLAAVLQAQGLVRLDPQAQVERGISSTFFPHGLGHLIGLQVHDVAGLQRDELGGHIDRPPGHPFLRLTRTLSPGMVVTIEPGIYFIPSLLERLRRSPQAGVVDWGRVEHLSRFGGVRIEDDVVCRDAAPENLTRDAFATAA